MAEFLFWTSLGAAAYVYVGYPLLLALVCLFSPRRESVTPVEWPTVTLVVSAFNEGGVIEEKLRNSLALDYPRERLDIMVVSDASDDGTDDIVRAFEGEGVRLVRMATRGGKTLGLNAAIDQCHSDIVVFSDANAMYETEAVKEIATSFVPPEVGAVIGESTYDDIRSDSDRSEGLYWRYETWIKEMESRTGSVVGGDGAIYGVRRNLYEPMAADALSDFVNPLQVVRRGAKCIYTRRARSRERAAGDFGKEFKRKVRIVNRAWRATMRMRSMLNPFTYGWFALKLVSHKLLRWLVPMFLFVALISNGLLWGEAFFYTLTLSIQIGFYIAAAIGFALRDRPGLPAVLYVSYYFCLVNLASACGLIDAFRGETYTTWTTARAAR